MGQLTHGRRREQKAHRIRRPGLHIARRAGWNIGDQLLSAVTNVVMAFLVARTVDARGFGAFSIAFVVFSILVGCERALVGQPLSIVHSKVQPAEMALAIRAGTGTALAMGLIVGAGSILVGLALGGVTGHAIIAVGVVLPGLLMQDCCRMIFFAQLRPALATVNDTVWAVLQFSVMAVLVGSGVKNVAAYVVAWGGSAAVAAAVGLVQLRHWPQFSKVRWWVEEHRKLAGYLLAEYLLGTGTYQSGVVLIGGFVGVQAVGSLRAAQVLIGPVGILATGISTFALPELVKRGELSALVRAKVAFAISAVLVAATALFGFAILIFPDDLGKKLLGDTWTGASSVLLPVVAGSVALCASAGPGIIAYSMGQARITFRMHVLEAPILLTCVIVGVHLGGVRGAAWGMALTFAIMTPIWVYQLKRLLQPGRVAYPTLH